MMQPDRRRSAGPIALAASLLTAIATTRADEGSTSAAGEVRLPSGHLASYEYHFNRNALRDSLPVGDALIALTGSGNLLRFDAATLELTGEWFGPVPVASIGRGEGDALLVGFEDGRIALVDPETFAIEELARVPEAPRWVGLRADGRGIVAVTDWVRRVDHPDVNGSLPASIVHDLAADWSYPTDRTASAFLLDREGRFWLGTDDGEWGGWAAVVDFEARALRHLPGLPEPDAGPMTPFEDPGWRDGVYGFAELADGRVLAFGGMIHMGSTSSFVRRVDGPEATTLYESETFPTYNPFGAHESEVDPRHHPADARREVDGPLLPISNVLEQPDGRLLVFSFDDVFRTDADFNEWERVGTIELQYRWGRPDAVGLYPSITAVHPAAAAGGVVIATALDGYLTLGPDGEARGHAIPGQLGPDRVERIEPSRAGTLFLERDAALPPWRLGADGWEPVSLAPPVVLHPDDPEARGDEPPASWSETAVVVAPGGAVFTVSECRYTRGTRVTARWADGEAEVLGREVSNLYLYNCFATPDGALWNADRDALLRLVDGRWREVVPYPEAPPDDYPLRWQDADPGPIRLGPGVREIGEGGPPWLLLDPSHLRLLRLSYEPTIEEPRLKVIPVLDESLVPLGIRDAIPWEPGVLLLATYEGLRRFEVGEEADEPIAGPSPIGRPDGMVRRLCRDGSGRLWLAGDGLWLVDPETDEPIALEALPMLGRSGVAAIAPDPERPDGVITAIEGRGVVFVAVPDGR